MAVGGSAHLAALGRLELGLHQIFEELRARDRRQRIHQLETCQARERRAVGVVQAPLETTDALQKRIGRTALAALAAPLARHPGQCGQRDGWQEAAHLRLGREDSAC